MAKILLIEDSRPFLLLIREVLYTGGHEVVASCSGAAAARRLKSTKVDLILTDLYMREPDGFDVVSVVRTLQPGVPLVIMTGNAQACDVFARNRALGAAAALQKPFSMVKLLATVDEVLAREAATPKPASRRKRGSKRTLSS